MKRVLLLLGAFVLCSFLVSAVSGPYNLGGKQYYVVTSTNPAEDSGDEVCATVGKTCIGYTEPSNAICKTVHSGAASSTSVSGDQSGIYCDGTPQNGVCAALTDSCHTCPACTVSVQCNQAIGGLYREMYVECSPGSCSLSISATDTQAFLNAIPSINAQLAGCPQSIPKSAGYLVKSGNTVVNIQMNSGTVSSFTVGIANNQVNRISSGAAAICAQKITISENDFDTALQSQDLGQAVAYLLGQGRLKVSGCTAWSKIKLAIVSPFVKIVAKKAVPQPPPPVPPPNCGQIGEQCDNRACWSGMCASVKENVNGQWGYWRYTCIDQTAYTANCIGQGNTPPAWNCLTGICR